MNPALSHHQTACRSLSSAGLIRLVSEIDDHGAIPPRALARTLSDLSTTQIRTAMEQADRLGLLDRSGSGLGLSPAGRGLADLYDAIARWARHHNHPQRIGTFTERIRSVLSVLAEPASTEPLLRDDDATTGLGHIRRLLADWVETHQQPEHQSSYGVAA
ncbi:regulator [Streptomyces sp. NPDC090994]|uniref:regulator n=1 Tax=Streptomyces sp. NPDC090994 TaxID=3365969 RepID=UPI00380A3074